MMIFTLSIVIALGIGNFIYQAMTSRDWALAAVQTGLQAIFACFAMAAVYHWRGIIELGQT